MFTTAGERPFEDSVYTMALDGTALTQILVPNHGRSFMYASGNSLTAGLAVTVHELDSSSGVQDRLYLYSPLSGDWNRLLKDDGLMGEARISPDGSSLAFIHAPNSQRTQIRVWVMDLKTREARKLTDDEIETWDGYLSWRPDSKEISFLRLRQTPGGVATTLRLVSLSDSKSKVLLESDRGAVAACYAPDGERLAVLTKDGLAVNYENNLGQELILPWTALPNTQFRTGGLIWSKTSNQLAFAVFNKLTSEYEIWVISSNGSNPKKIYSHDQSKGKISVTSFLND